MVIAEASIGEDGVMSEERLLPQGLGGSMVSVSGVGVHRTAGPWTPTVHAFLDHLHAAGFTAAPEVVGIDAEGREVLTFIEGEVLGDPLWRPGRPTPWPPNAQTEGALVTAGQLLGELHRAAASFVPADAIWKQYEWPGLVDGQIVCHGDIGPHNTVYRDGLPVAFIDWETIRPEQPLIEFGAALWHFVPLGSDDYFRISGFGATPPLAERLAAFAAAYGVTAPDDVLRALHQSKQRSTERFRYYPIGPGEGAQGLRQVADALAWLDDRVEALLAAL